MGAVKLSGKTKADGARSVCRDVVDGICKLKSCFSWVPSVVEWCLLKFMEVVVYGFTFLVTLTVDYFLCFGMPLLTGFWWMCVWNGIPNENPTTGDYYEGPSRDAYCRWRPPGANNVDYDS